MGADWYLVTVANEAELEALLQLLLTTATAITAYFPEDHLLGSGKALFAALPQATTAEWDGMADCMMISSPLDHPTRELAKAWAIPSGLLWQYELLKDGQPFLKVADFDVYMLRADDADLKMIQRTGISTNLWARVNLTGSVTAQQLTEPELKALKDKLDPRD